MICNIISLQSCHNHPLIPVLHVDLTLQRAAAGLQPDMKVCLDYNEILLSISLSIYLSVSICLLVFVSVCLSVFICLCISLS